MAHFYFENTPHGKQKNGQKLNTKTHYNYICREEKYSKMKNREEDLVYSTSGNMPEWSDNPGDFWEQAELNRNKNGRAYREFRIALQEELSLEENMALIEQLIKETGIKDNHAYSYAIHDKTATFDKEHKNIHCHLMFNEKIIEPDRKLKPEKYFNNYYENRNGEPTQGYRTSDYFDQKATTIQLRKRWAEIVNDKFQEKGMSCRITEKSLPNQSKDLLAQGKIEEAELLNRTPAPHLGSAYRNPQTMSFIMERIKEVDTETDNPDSDSTQDIENMSKVDQNILIFAQDIVIRKVAREILIERLKLEKEQEAEIARHKADEIAEEPLIITTGDIYNYMDDSTKVQQKATADKIAAYKALRATILNDNQLVLHAKEKLFNGQYAKTMKEYSIVSNNLKAMKNKASTLYGVENKLNELATCSRSIHDLTEKRYKLGKQINYYKNSISGKDKEKYEAILEQLKNENNQKIIDSKKLYSQYAQEQKQAEKYIAVIEELKNEKMDKIIFTDKLPSQLTRKCKINGTYPISKMQVMAFKSESYAVMSDVSKQADMNIYIDQKGSTCSFVEAVKIGDSIVGGKVPIYKLQLVQTDSKKWKVNDIKQAVTYKVGINKMETKNKFAPIYKTGSINNEKNPPIKSMQHPIIQEAKKQRAEENIAKISHIAGKFVSEGKSANFKGHWNQEDEAKTDKAKLAEQKIYNEWSL